MSADTAANAADNAARPAGPAPKLLAPADVDTIIYHGDCADGACGAAVLAGAARGPVRYYPAAPGRAPPTVPAGSRLAVVDITFAPAEMARLYADAAAIVVLDHHRTAADNLAGFEPACAVVDESRSGARLAWDWARGGEPPAAVGLVEARDLWRRTVTADSLAAWIAYRVQDRPDAAGPADPAAVPHDVGVLARLVASDVVTADAAAAGLHLAARSASEAKRCGGRARLVFTEVAGRYYIAAVVNSTGDKSEVGAAALAANPAADFAAVFEVRGGATTFSLRSAAGRADVAAVAAGLGGGGHAHAAGCRVPALAEAPGDYARYDGLAPALAAGVGVDAGPLAAAVFACPVHPGAAARYLAQPGVAARLATYACRVGPDGRPARAAGDWRDAAARVGAAVVVATDRLHYVAYGRDVPGETVAGDLAGRYGPDSGWTAEPHGDRLYRVTTADL